MRAGGRQYDEKPDRGQGLTMNFRGKPRAAYPTAYVQELLSDPYPDLKCMAAKTCMAEYSVY